MFKFLIVAAFAFASAVDVPLPIFPGQCRTPEELGGVHTNFDLSRYLGLWYEIERYEQFFQLRGECVTAQYTLNSNPDGVRVMNTLRDVQSNTWRSDVGLAVVANPDETPLRAQLRVTFPINGVLPENSNYWVLRTDYANYAIVVSCQQLNATARAESYWFLSRSHPPTANARLRADEIIDRHLDRNFIRPTQQGIQECFAEPRP